jgi:hypothetical protein
MFTAKIRELRSFLVVCQIGTDSLGHDQHQFQRALKISSALQSDQRDALLDRLDEVRSISHNFGYGVGNEMDILLVEQKDDA